MKGKPELVDSFLDTNNTKICHWFDYGKLQNESIKNLFFFSFALQLKESFDMNDNPVLMDIKGNYIFKVWLTWLSINFNITSV